MGGLGVWGSKSEFGFGVYGLRALGLYALVVLASMILMACFHFLALERAELLKGTRL